MNREMRSALLLFLTAAIWGFAMAFQREGSRYLGPFAFNACRFLLGGCAMLPLRVSESACLGAARLAGVGAGWYADIDRAADALLNTGGEFLPDPALKPLYDRRFERYIALYEALKPVFAGA